MGNRAFQMVVALLWLLTMTWLVVSKVLPPLWRGDPPTHRSTLPNADGPVCWDLSWNGRSVGWAASRLVEGAEGASNLYHRVVIREFPVDQLAPAAIASLVRRSVGTINLDAKTRLELDPLGELAGVHATIRLAELDHAVSMLGSVEGDRLRLQLRFADLVEPEEIWVPLGAFVTSELAPRAEMPNLFVGQRWTEEVFSPLRRPGSPLEVLAVEVEDRQRIEFGGASIDTFVVVFRSDPGSGLRSLEETRGRVWVAPDGRILQQELALLKSKLRMVRMAPRAGLEHLQTEAADWLADPSLVR